MTDAEKTKMSKFLSLVLRHEPEIIGLNLSEDGWVEVDSLLKKTNASGKISLDLATLKIIVATNDKKRFAFNEDFTKIRASQGHSIEVNLGYRPQTPPDVLFHGTATKFVASILENGLKKQERHHVHLSQNLATAISVGKRHGKVFVFEVLAKAMFDDGFVFLQSENGVWLTESVPTRYLKPIPEDEKK